MFINMILLLNPVKAKIKSNKDSRMPLEKEKKRHYSYLKSAILFVLAAAAITLLVDDNQACLEHLLACFECLLRTCLEYFLRNRHFIKSLLLSIVYWFLTLFIAGFFGKCLESLGVSTTKVSIFLFMLSLFIYEAGLSNCFAYIQLIIWISSELLDVDWEFLFDSLTAVMRLISFSAHLFKTPFWF